MDGKPAGGAVFDYVEGCVRGRKLSFGIDWYIFLDMKYRAHGLGKMLHERMLASLRQLSLKRGSCLDIVFCEMNDIKRMKPRDMERDKEVAIDPEERLEFFNSLGYRKIDASRFLYIQPQLTKKAHPCRELILAVKPIGKNFRVNIPADYLKHLLSLYIWAGFAGIPGSDVKGHRKPETDAAFLGMEKQLERLESLELLPLVKDSDIRIEPLSRRTLGPATNLLNIIFHYEKEIPEVCLRASLKPKAYRKKLKEWDIPELRYWVALKSGKVAGTIGLYSYNKDRKEANWLGWFAVSTHYRKHGIGKNLLDFAIYNAKLSGKKYLRLYTSDNPNEKEAHRLYEKKGFVKIREEDTPGWKGRKIVYEMGLKS